MSTSFLSFLPTFLPLITLKQPTTLEWGEFNYTALAFFYTILWKRYLYPLYHIIFSRPKHPTSNSNNYGSWAVIHNLDDDSIGKEYARYLVQHGINVCYLKKWKKIDYATAKIKSELLCDKILQNSSSTIVGCVQILGYNENDYETSTTTRLNADLEKDQTNHDSQEKAENKKVDIYNSWTSFYAMLRVTLGKMHLDGGIGYCIYNSDQLQKQDTFEAISVEHASSYLKFRSTGAMIRLVEETSPYHQKIQNDSVHQKYQDFELHNSAIIDFLTVILPSKLNGFTIQEMIVMHTIATFQVLGIYPILSFRISQIISICNKLLTYYPLLSESNTKK